MSSSTNWTNGYPLHFFKRTGGVWSENQVLGTAISGRKPVDIDGDTVVVGRGDGTFVYYYNGTTWSQQGAALLGIPDSFGGTNVAIDPFFPRAGGRSDGLEKGAFLNVAQRMEVCAFCHQHGYSGGGRKTGGFQLAFHSAGGNPRLRVSGHVEMGGGERFDKGDVGGPAIFCRVGGIKPVGGGELDKQVGVDRSTIFASFI